MEPGTKGKGTNKGNAHLQQRPGLKFQFIEEHRSVFRIEKMCSVLGVSRSGYYKWRATPPSERKKHRERLVQRIEYHFHDNGEIYGSPKITKKLQQEGFTVGEKTVG
ncbi:IS3 family transposase [Paenibacillus riograndensis]|uniref:HTH-like domain-containing protein n=1 Tax=Paenibacillus riograndensis SBR5 TaxID=1073571 RepID=A0A0E4CY04_9BACL|nr:IS3 family transposase [Paenibacillus riograndensis]CQR56974.1 hypothetical protein PRIO_4572 [Paenibacillus riograndensis SBR5]